MNQMVKNKDNNKNRNNNKNKDNSSNSLVFGRCPQTKIKPAKMQHLLSGISAAI